MLIRLRGIIHRPPCLSLQWHGVILRPPPAEPELGSPLSLHHPLPSDFWASGVILLGSLNRSSIRSRGRYLSGCGPAPPGLLMQLQRSLRRPAATKPLLTAPFPPPLPLPLLLAAPQLPTYSWKVLGRLRGRCWPWSPRSAAGPRCWRSCSPSSSAPGWGLPAPPWKTEAGPRVAGPPSVPHVGDRGPLSQVPTPSPWVS